jgi:Ribonuclease G/E
MADEAEDEALGVEHPLPGGGSLAIEITRALTAVDVDLGAGGGQDAKRAARQANMNAIAILARLLRLKALGGLVVIDLVGRGHDGPALARAAQTAFGPDQPGVIIGPITKFGTLELALPRRYQPVRDALCGSDGRLSAASLALRAMRSAETQAKADPGGRLTLRCAPEVAESAKLLLPALIGIIGARLEVVPEPALARDAWEIATR